MFFVPDRQHFFRPLGGKYREVLVACLKAFHERLYGPDADYSHHITRDDLRDIFVQAIQANPAAASADEADEPDDLDASDERALAGSIIRVLVREGWIEEFTDRAAILTKAFRFTRTGKAFAAVFATLDAPRLRTRQRNVRSVKNSLEAFLRNQDPYDLADALNYSRQVVDDFSEDITQLYDAKKQLIKEAVERRAIDFFIDYTQKAFLRDIAVRFSADSVEKHRHRIAEAIAEIGMLPPERLARANTQLASMLPEFIGAEGSTAVERALESIEHIVTAACDSKVPELRAALSGFVSRANLIVRQSSVLASGTTEAKVGQTIEKLSLLPLAEQDRLLAEMGRQMALASVKLPDPGTIRPRRKIDRKQATTLSIIPPKTREQLIEAAIQESLTSAFEVSPQRIKAHLSAQLHEHGRVALSELVVSDVPSLLAATHALEAAALGVEPVKDRLFIKRTGALAGNPYVSFEDFIIRRPE